MPLQRIQLNFVPRSFFSSGRSLAWLFCSIFFLISATLFYWHTSNALNNISNEKNALEKRLGITSSVSGDARKSVLESIGEAIERPWLSLLNDLESSIDDQVMLLRVEPNPKNHEIVLVGECIRVEDVVSFIRRLDRTPSIKNARLTSQKVRDSAEGMTIEFTITATWRGAK